MLMCTNFFNWLGSRSSLNTNFKLFEILIGNIRNLYTGVSQFTTHNSRFTVKAIAFTLAETLIVIGVIGIVSALTLPNLNNSTGEKEKVAKVKKIYQNLQDAFTRAEAVYGPYSGWFINDGNDAAAKSKRAGERMTEFMKISKTCGVNAGQGCFTSGQSKILAGNDAQSLDEGFGYKIITTDGTSINIDPVFAGGTIQVDIDGPNKGSYTFGKDLFIFAIVNDLGVVPMGYNLAFGDLISATLEAKEGNASAAWIIKYDNADYLQLKDSNGTCKNGNVMTESSPTCK